MAMIAEDRPVFENEEWVVTEDGLEHRFTGYFIGREDLPQRRHDNLWAWPLHMAEKTWCTMAPFTEAFSCATSLYGIKVDTDLAQSFKIARREIASWSNRSNAVRKEHDEDAFSCVESTPDVLQNKAGITISSLSGRSDIRVSTQGRTASVLKETGHSRSPMRGYASYYGGKGRPGRFVTGTSWQTSYGIRKAGSRIVQLLQAAWNTK